MKIVAKKDRKLLLINTGNTQNENKAETIELTVPEEYEDYNKKIVFVTDNGIVWDIIQDNTYKLTKAITKYKQVDFYIWLTKDDVDFRTETRLLRFYYNKDASGEITPEEISGVNTVVNILEEEITKVDSLETELRDLITDIQNKLDNGEFDGEDGYTPQKGIDYFTQQDIEEIENGVKNDLQETVLVDYSLITETGSKIELSINTTNYKLTAILKDKNNATICTSNEIDLPLETMVVNATYDNTTKKIILTLQNGTTVEFSVADLVSGLVSESQLQTILANYYTKTEINNLLANKVDKVAGKGLSTNDFTDEYKEQVDTNTEDIEDIQDEQTEQNTEIEKLQTENARLKATLPTTTGEGQNITLNKTAELEFKKPPLPMGNSEQESTNNLLYLDSVRGGLNDIQPTLENGIVHLKGTNNEEYNTKGSSRNGYVTLNTTEKWKPSTAYYVSFKMEIISNPKALDTSYFSCGLFGEIFDNVQYNTTTGRYEKQINTPSSISDTANNKRYLEIRVDGMEVNISEVSLKTVEDYTFDEYGIKPSPEHESPITNVTGDVEVKVQNKNRIRIDNSAYSNNGIQAVIQDGQITLNGTATANSIISIPFAYKFNTQEYTISANNPIANTNVIIRFDNNVIPFELNSINKTYTNTFSEEKNVNYLTIRTANGTTLTNFIIKPQLEEGSTATTYTPHKEQVFIFPLGNEKLMLGDYLADDGIHHVRKQVVLDGSEDWTTYMTGNTENYNCFAIRLETSFKKSNNQFLLINAFSNYFKEVAWIYIYNSSLKQDKPAFGFTIDNNKYAYIKVNNAISTAQDLKTWLAQKYANNSPVIIEYPLNEEVIVPYTSAQQEVYNQIKQAISYEEQTNISSNTIALFNVEAYQSTKLVLEEMATAIVALGGV